ncbi:MAG: ribosome small subunit-dependent GTPase A [Deltaproteobacteria bacterium]|nr:ribosome small subunit-dependent GTPase A [Deltaproteobacteria bacterium]
MTDSKELELGRVLRAHAGFFDVETAEGLLQCRIRGRLKKKRLSTDICVAGDEVRVVETAPGVGVVEEVLPRRSVFARLHPGRGKRREDVLCANLDQLLVVFSFYRPRMKARTLDRFLVVAEERDVPVVIVANKADLASDEERALLSRYARIGYRVLETSATTQVGLRELSEICHDHVSAMSGPSGVGKSSLANALDPRLAIRVGATSEAHGKGRHTTRVAELHPLPDGGYLVDTPGIRELASYDLAQADLDHCFPEMRELLGQCAFRGCAHDSEPRCAIREAVSTGDIHPERYESYLRLRATTPR